MPGPGSAFTASLNYWGGAAVYGAILVLAYISMLLILRNADVTDVVLRIASVGVGEDPINALEKEIKEQGDQIHVWLASLLTFAIPTVPVLSRIDRSIRARVQQMFGIPEFAWRLADRLETHREFRFQSNVEEHFKRIANVYLHDMNITADQLHDARQCDELYIRMLCTPSAQVGQFDLIA